MNPKKNLDQKKKKFTNSLLEIAKKKAARLALDLYLRLHLSLTQMTELLLYSQSPMNNTIVHGSTVCIRDVDKLYLNWWFDFRLKPIFATAAKN